MNMKTLVAIVLAMALLCSCGSKPAVETTVPTTAPVVETTAPTTEPMEFEEQENPVTFFSLSLGEDYENVKRMDVFYVAETDNVYVEYVGAERKIGYMGTEIFDGITAAFLESGLMAMDGKDVYEEGEANGSMYVEFKDGGVAMVGFSGKIPEEFVQGYEVMDKFFQVLTAGLEVYVPQPMVFGEVEPEMFKATMEILNGSGIEALDSFTISLIEKDEYFAFTAGLTSAEGVVDAVSVAPMMMTTAYSLVIVRLEDASKAEAICKDFEENLDWTKWVCVAPSSAVIAQKGDMVLCLMTFEGLEEGTPAGIRDAGWTEIATFENPNMQ